MESELEAKIYTEMHRDMNGISFYTHMKRNGQDTRQLVSDVEKLIIAHGLSASEAKGFCDYMKIVIELTSRLHHEK